MAARFWVGGTGNWNDTAHWSTTTGGASGAAVPTSSDAVTVDGSSGSGTITVNVAANASTLTLNNVNITISQSASLTAANTLTLTTGSFITNGQALTVRALAAGGSSTRSLDITGSAVTVTGSGSPTWTTSPSSGLTLTTASSSITFTDVTATAKSINSGGKTYGDLTVNGGSTSGTFTMFGGGSYGVITFAAGKSVVMTASTTVTCTNLIAWGSSGNLITFTSSTPGTQWTISCSSRTYIWCDWLSLTDSKTAGTTAFYAGADSTNVSGNTGWTFAHWSMNAAPVAVSTAAGTVTTTAPLTGSASAISSSSGALRVPVFLAGTPVSISTAVGRLIYLPPPSKPLLIRERPPVRLEIGVKSPTGATSRWAADEHKPENVPSALTFSSTMPGGFEQAGLTLPRKPSLDYPDLAEFSDVTIRGVGGQVAWHGRIDTTPRTSGDQRSVSPSCVGWQSHLDANEGVQMIYVAQSPSLWTDAPLTEQIRVAQAAISYGDMSWSSQNGGLVCSLPNQAISATSVAELWFVAPSGVLIAKVMYVGQDTTMPAGWEAPSLLEHSDTLEAPATVDGLTFDGTLHTTTCTTPSRAVSVRVYSNGTAATPATGSQRALSAVGVYGNHGLTTRAIGAATPDGLLASDIVAHALQAWAPLVNFTTGPSGSIQPSSFVIPHIIFTSLPTKVSDVLVEALKYELLDWAIWENKTFYMNQRGARGTEWRARVGPAGLQEAGPQSGRIWNSVITQYADVDGTRRTVGPPGSGCDTEDASLVDPDPLNPANQAGETRRAVTAMGTSTAAGAIQVSARFLAEQKLLDTSGQANIVGHVQDSAGVWWPAWQMRAGDTCSFIDAHDTTARRIVKTNYVDATKANAISLDSPPQALPELLDRLSIVLVDLGLS